MLDNDINYSPQNVTTIQTISVNGTESKEHFLRILTWIITRWWYYPAICDPSSIPRWYSSSAWATGDAVAIINCTSTWMKTTLHEPSAHGHCRQGVSDHQIHFIFELRLTTPNGTQQVPYLMISHHSIYTWWLQIPAGITILLQTIIFRPSPRSRYIEMRICGEHWTKRSAGWSFPPCWISLAWNLCVSICKINHLESWQLTYLQNYTEFPIFSLGDTHCSHLSSCKCWFTFVR